MFHGRHDLQSGQPWRNPCRQRVSPGRWRRADHSANSRDRGHRGLAAAAQQPNGGIFVPLDVTLNAFAEQIIATATRHRLPAVYPDRIFVTSGGLVSYGTKRTDLYRRSAVYIDRILRGEKAGDLPIQQPTKYELVINLKTAKALGLAIPSSLLFTADEVIE